MGLGTWDLGLGDSRTLGRWNTETRGRWDVGTRGLGDVGTLGLGDTARRVGTRGRDKQTTPDFEKHNFWRSSVR